MARGTSFRSALQDAPNWNLFHFMGAATPVPRLDDLWDVTLAEIGDSGEWELVVRDYLTPGGSTVYSGPDAQSRADRQVVSHRASLEARVGLDW